MTDLDLCYTPATELARLIRDKEISPVEVTRNALDRIDDVNGALNCYCFTYPEEALAKARDLETAVARGDDLGPLAGVPVAIKDLTPTKGKRTTLGSYAFEHNVPDHDAAVVERLLGAGAILVGKTTTPEFAFAGFTESPLWGITRNPWNTACTPGGSSGGSGAAVAAGTVPFAEGSDMGGSVRIPAAECGIVGLKPSLGRIPQDILPSVFDNISHLGPLARTVDDAALFLSVAHGPDDRDILSLPDQLDIAIPVGGNIRGLKIAYSANLGFYRVDDEVAANTRAALDALRERGAVVEEVELNWTVEVISAWNTLWDVFMAAFFGHLLDEWRDRFDPAIVRLIERGNEVGAADYKRIEMIRTGQWRDLAAIFARYDALVVPTMAKPAPPVEDKTKPAPLPGDDGLIDFRTMTMPFNMVPQCPVLAVPSGFTAAGLPTSVSIVGHRYDDLGVLRIGAALEAALNWPARHPPI
jgi:Asp-tRNA(Asn)/Glu-tRNA(Gln) amidotransferase A subunit family amidase